MPKISVKTPYFDHHLCHKRGPEKLLNNLYKREKTTQKQ